MKYGNPSNLVVLHEIDKEPSHVIDSNRPSNIHRASWRVRRWFFRIVGYQVAIIDDVVEVSVEVSTTKHAWKVSLAFLAENHALAKVPKTRIIRWRDSRDNLNVSWV